MGRRYNLILGVSVQIAGVAGTCQQETRCVVSVRHLWSHTPAALRAAYSGTSHTQILAMQSMNSLCQMHQSFCRCGFDYRPAVRGQAGAGLNTQTSHNSWLPVGVCAALGVNRIGAVVFPSPHLHVELDLKKVFGIIKSISSMVSYSVITIKRC